MKHRWIAWLILICGTILCRAIFLENTVYNIDEAEYGVAANGLDHGLLSGVDFLGSNKTPGIVFLYNLLFHLFGHSLIVTRVAYMLMLVIEGGLLVEMTISLWGITAAIPAAVLFWAVAHSFDIPPDMVPLNTEGPAMLFAVVAIWLAWWKPDDRRAVIGAGAALGLSVLFRQSSVFFLIPVVTALMISSEQRIRRIIYLAIGGIGVWIPFLVLYALHHGLGWAWDSWVRYPLEYAGDVGATSFAWRLCYMGGEFAFQLAIPVALALGGVVLLLREKVSAKIVLVGSLFAGSFLALCTGARFFGHYWVQMFPIVALLGVPAWLHLAHGTRKAKLLLGAGLLVTVSVAALHFNTWRTWDPYATPPGISFFHLDSDNAELQLALFAKEHLTPDETFCVWGYCPQIYWHADRLPAVRDFICHYIVGYSPGVTNLLPGPSERPLGHPLAVKMFIDDLERHKAKYIFDLSPIRNYPFSFLNYPISCRPELALYVRMKYLPEGHVGDAVIYRRRIPSDPPLNAGNDAESSIQ